jgi:hypothetical protein
MIRRSRPPIESTADGAWNKKNDEQSSPSKL